MSLVCSLSKERRARPPARQSIQWPLREAADDCDSLLVQGGFLIDRGKGEENAFSAFFSSWS